MWIGKNKYQVPDTENSLLKFDWQKTPQKLLLPLCQKKVLKKKTTLTNEAIEVESKWLLIIDCDFDDRKMVFCTWYQKSKNWQFLMNIIRSVMWISY